MRIFRPSPEAKPVTNSQPPPARQARGGPGIGRPSSQRAEMVSDDLRRGSTALLRQRRRVFGLSLASAASLGVVALYQSGILRHLPDPPIGPFDSDTVDASGEAYHYLLTPDAAIGIASYAVTAVLAGMGTRDRASERPWIPLALAGKVASDALGAGFLTLEQISKHRKLCFWCLAAALTSVLAVPAALPEARLAWRHLCSPS